MLYVISIISNAVCLNENQEIKSLEGKGKKKRGGGGNILLSFQHLSYAFLKSFTSKENNKACAVFTRCFLTVIVPVVVQQPLVGVANDEPNTIIVSWTDVFDLRSKLEGYFVTENKLLAYSGTSTTNLTRPNRTAGCEFVISVRVISIITFYYSISC